MDYETRKKIGVSEIHELLEKFNKTQGKDNKVELMYKTFLSIEEYIDILSNHPKFMTVVDKKFKEILPVETDTFKKLGLFKPIVYTSLNILSDNPVKNCNKIKKFKKNVKLYHCLIEKSLGVEYYSMAVINFFEFLLYDNNFVLYVNVYYEKLGEIIDDFLSKTLLIECLDKRDVFDKVNRKYRAYKLYSKIEDRLDFSI